MSSFCDPLKRMVWMDLFVLGYTLAQAWMRSRGSAQGRSLQPRTWRSDAAESIAGASEHWGSQAHVPGIGHLSKAQELLKKIQEKPVAQTAGLP